MKTTPLLLAAALLIPSQLATAESISHEDERDLRRTVQTVSLQKKLPTEVQNLVSCIANIGRHETAPSVKMTPKSGLEINTNGVLIAWTDGVILRVQMSIEPQDNTEKSPSIVIENMVLKNTTPLTIRNRTLQATKDIYNGACLMH